MPPRAHYQNRARGRGTSSPARWRTTARVVPEPACTMLGSVSSSRVSTSRNFELIASVSRSSGLEKDGDALKDFKTQEDYREFIQNKLDGYWRCYPPHQLSQDNEVMKVRKEIEGNILILFRKLREGLYASKRVDDFAIEVYETSLRLAIIFDIPKQIESVVSNLIADFYVSTPKPPSPWIALLILLHALVSSGSSQKAFHDTHRELSKSYSLEPPVDTWLTVLARSLRRCNFERFAKDAQIEVIVRLLPARPDDSVAEPDLPVLSLELLLNRLRAQARLLSWRVFRSSYVEIGSTIRPWLARQLLFDISQPRDKDAFDSWILESERKGEIGKKEGATDRWAVKIKR